MTYQPGRNLIGNYPLCNKAMAEKHVNVRICDFVSKYRSVLFFLIRIYRIDKLHTKAKKLYHQLLILEKVFFAELSKQTRSLLFTLCNFISTVFDTSLYKA